jgi:glucosamine--fructose-6-phosphate aminotransferase (isomerizing)
MCGIVGYVGKRNAVPILMEGLHQLEYRGYDSAGLAIARASGLAIHKAEGKVRALEAGLPKRLSGRSGIAHTRWATHGEPSDANAHPHSDPSGRFAVVHNGIVENAVELRAGLVAAGAVFASETDTEVLAHLIAASGCDDVTEAVQAVLRGVEGTYGLAVLDARHPDRIVVARNGSPVILGIGRNEMLVASDAAALVRHTQQVIYLDDGEIATVRADGYETATLDARPTTKTPTRITLAAAAHDKAGHEHFMRKEILEQPETITRCLQGRLDRRFNSAHFGGLNLDARELLDIRRIKILGCGSACIAGLAGAHMIESLARIPASAEPASEFRYRNPVIERDTLYIAVSQSGETLDTLMAVGCWAWSTWSARPSRASAMAGSIFMPAPRSPWSRPRPSRPCWWSSRCWPSISAASAICRRPMAGGLSRAWDDCPTRCGKFSRGSRRSRRWPRNMPEPPMPSSSAGRRPSRWRSKGR